jgi:predicted MFS family arabinose efflux permease
MAQQQQTVPGRAPLLALNFFMADVQAGLGPFLGVYLLAHGWKSGMIGTVMTLGGISGLIAAAPAGAIVDATRRKRSLVTVSGLFTLLASGALLLSRELWVVSASQIASAIAGAAIGPAVMGITLGMVRQRASIARTA